MDAERGPARYMHPMMQNRNAASSLPNLMPTGTPAGSRGASALQSGRSNMSGMQRDMSHGNLPGSRPGGLNIGTGTPGGVSSLGAQQMADPYAVGNTLKFTEPAPSDGMMSRRSMSSNGGNYRDNQ